jgi:hypothetical protein
MHSSAPLYVTARVQRQQVARTVMPALSPELAMVTLPTLSAQPLAALTVLTDAQRSRPDDLPQLAHVEQHMCHDAER